MLAEQLREAYDNRFVALGWALKYDPSQPRDPKGSPTGGQFSTFNKATFDPTKKETWYGFTSDWHTDPEGNRPYGWHSAPPDYEPPPIQHKVLRMPYSSSWGASHGGSTAITGESAQQMGLEGWTQSYSLSDELKAVSTRMLEEIANDTIGSEEPLYHSFQNVRHTVFSPGDTMKLPLMASSGKPETIYGIRSYYEDQEGPPIVFVFPKGTPMVAYSPSAKQSDVRNGDIESIEAGMKESGRIWDEAIVAGEFRIVKVETMYTGSQHREHGTKTGEPSPQLYGQVVYLESIGVFDPATKTWKARG